MERKNDTVKDIIINNIVQKEWDMFVNVNNIGGQKASCQRDNDTFYIMRYSQHNSFSEEFLNSYSSDLDKAKETGRNLLTEKYAYMMEYTDKEHYDKYIHNKIRQPEKDELELVYKISKEMTEFRKIISTKYPNFDKNSRPVVSDSNYQATALIYLIGELKTYSKNTLVKMLDDINKAKEENKNIAFEILTTTARFYGYNSIEDAEEYLKRKNGLK